MRALFDPNVFVSYLPTPGGSSPPVAIVEAALAGVFSLLLTAGVVAEVRAKSATKPYLAARITLSEVEELFRLLSAVAEILPELDEVPKASRDRKDDYLLAHAAAARADYLVSGDADLLSLNRIGNVTILNPAGFLRVLQDAELV